MLRRHRPWSPVHHVAGSALCRSTHRRLTIMPEQTKDSLRFPLGYAPLQGSESVDVLYALLKEGHYVSSHSKLQYIDKVFYATKTFLETEYPASNMDDLIVQHRMKQELLSRIVIPRRFFELEDWNDPELYRSFGYQNRFFDHYMWSARYSHDFKDYVQRHFPLGEHTHLTYPEYLQLISFFAAEIQGVQAEPAIPKKYRLKPDFGTDIPSFANRSQMGLLAEYLKAWAPPLMINKALVLRAGAGLAAFTTRLTGVKLVRSTDPSPVAIESARKDARRFGYNCKNMSWRVADLFPSAAKGESAEDAPRAFRDASPPGTKDKKDSNKYDCIILNPDAKWLEDPVSECRYPFAPGLDGTDGLLEQVFEEAHTCLRDKGVLIIVTSNFRDLAYPNKPNAIEKEIRTNRRWVLLDYMDIDARTRSFLPPELIRVSNAVLANLRKNLRLELWVLHRVESLPLFGWVHQIPGCAPPPTIAGRWKFRSLQSQRLKMMKARATEMGYNWGDYKSRLLSMLRDHGGESEDEQAQVARMLLDPKYPQELAARAKVKVEEKLEQERKFHESTEVSYPTGDFSPRQAFDDWATNVAREYGLTQMGSASKAGAAGPGKRKKGTGGRKAKPTLLKEEEELTCSRSM